MRGLQRALRGNRGARNDGQGEWEGAMIRRKTKRATTKSLKRNCDECGSSYQMEPWRVTRCCSIECSNKRRAREAWVEKKCRFCGHMFRGRRRDPNVACSQQCFYQSRRRVVACRTCGKQFEIGAYFSRTRKYCSPRCANVATRREMPIVNCQNCGKAVQWQTLTRPRKFCSARCARTHQVGPNNPQWRGKRSAERGVTWNKQRELARNRDRDTCQRCGWVSVKQQRVSVDHIVPYRLAVNYVASNPLYDPNDLFNLICLCRSCHSTKTVIESRLLEGDVLGFIQAVKPIIGNHRLLEAMRYSQLPVPEGLL